MRQRGPFGLIVLGVTLVCFGCGEDAKKKTTVWPDGGGPVDTGFLLDTIPVDLGNIPDGLPHSPEGPTIEVLTPKAGETIIGNVLTVEARIQDDDGVDDQSVTVQFHDAPAEKMSITAEQYVYRAKLDVTPYKNNIRIIVIAKDLLGNANSKVVDFMRDPGPKILFLSPGEGSRHKGSVSVQVLVTDKNTITDFSMRIGSHTLDLKNTSTDPQKQIWVGTVTFDDDMFDPPLSGKQVLIAEAENASQARAVEERSFFVDDKGPTITVSNQKAGQLIGGIISIKVAVSDPAGVVASSVRCIIGNNLDTRTVYLRTAPGSANVFEGQFDTRTLNQYQIWPVMSFRAADKLGNESHVEFEVALDNGSPIVELDPPRDYYMVRKKDGLYQCSQPFDPVGPFGASDLDQVPQIQELRVRIEDQGNWAPSSLWIPIATVNQSSARMYILDEVGPLVVDTDGDGYCDDINPSKIPLGSQPQLDQAVALDLKPLKPTGSANYVDPSFSWESMDPMPTLPPYCDSWGTATNPPGELCLSVLATVLIPYASTSLPAIYTIPPISSGASSFTCMGLPFDFKANDFEDGWVCVAVEATDELGNRGVSPPIRLYVKKDWMSTGSQPVEPSLAASAPNCTGTLDKQTGQVSATPCKFRNPREPTHASNASCTLNYCPDCMTHYGDLSVSSLSYEFPQMFYHCEGLLK